MNRDLLVALRHALESGPPTAEAHLRLGTALLEEGSPDAAEQELRAAIALDERCAAAWVNLGGILFSRWDFAGALEANRRAAEADPALAIAHFNQGLAQLMSGAPEPSLEAFGRTIALDPRHGAAYHHLGVALHALGRTVEAELCDAYARELACSPGRTHPASPPAAQGETHGTAQGR
jgi:superkiller protein 3